MEWGRGELQPSRAYRCAAALVSGVGCLVPTHHRERWREEWLGELWYELEESNPGPWRRTCLLARSLGTVADALTCRRVWARSARTGGASRWDLLTHDLWEAWRRLRRKPNYAAAVLVTFALAIGINTAVFSVIDPLLLRDLPFTQPGQLVRLWETFRHQDGEGWGSVSLPNLRDWAERSDTLQGIAAFQWGDFNLLEEGKPRRSRGLEVSPNLFPLLGTEPLFGVLPSGDYMVGEDLHGNGAVVVLSHEYWRHRFGPGGDQIGETLRLNGTPHTVVAVMPAGFDFPPASKTPFWVPLQASPDLEHRGDHHWHAVGRLSPDADLEAAKLEMSTIARHLEQEYPVFQSGRGLRLRPLQEQRGGGRRGVLLSLWLAAALVLLAGCANVANLMLARTARRRQELSVRAALGSGRARLLQTVFAEVVLLALLGGVLGLGSSLYFARLLARMPGSSVSETVLDPRVLAFNFFLTLGAALLSGLFPAWRVSRLGNGIALKQARKHGTAARLGLRGALVVGQLALAVVVLLGAALLAKSLHFLQAVDPGMRTDQLLTLRMSLSGELYEQAESRGKFYESLLSSVRQLPGVEDAGLISKLPLQSWGYNGEFSVAGRPPTDKGRPFAEIRSASTGYFLAADIPLLAGRSFGPEDQLEADPVVMVNQSLARRYWPQGGAVGSRISFANPPIEGTWLKVIGVVGDVRNVGLAREPEPELYLSSSQVPLATMSLVLHSRSSLEAQAEAVRGLMHQLDPQQPVYAVRSMEQVMGDHLARRRFSSALFSSFALLALILAAAGIYGPLSFQVSQRRTEVGLRMALGARRRQVLLLVLRRGFALAAWGIGLGLVSGTLLLRLLGTQLYEVSPTDPLVLCVVTGSLLLIATLATLLPAHRASALQPIQALRED